MKLLIWTEAYRPFLMGGDVHAPVATEIEVDQPPIDIGGGVQVYVLAAPNGKTYVAEASTGGFVGTDLEGVKRDLDTADPEVVRKQLEEGLRRREQATRLAPEEFWGMLR
jgi:hypothetical protein